MKVLKFGGTSVGSVENLKLVTNILTKDNETKIVVCSAMSGVTDHLVRLTDNIKFADSEAITKNLDALEKKHFELISSLIQVEATRNFLFDKVSSIITNLFDLSCQKYSEEITSVIITSGETLLTEIFAEYLKESGYSIQLLYARDFMYVDNVEHPNIDNVGQKLKKQIQSLPEATIYLTQGFVCRNKKNEISHLKRGGSDYTATIIGAAIDATEIQIWTDIDGLHNNDPRYVQDTHPIAHLTYNEAAELAYFGAKILHPQTVSPVVEKEIPVLLKNTFNPDAQGTVISSEIGNKGLKAISAKDGITAIKIKSNRMLMAHGFLRRIFEVFDKFETAIDMITTSEIAISLTIDDARNLEEITKEIKHHANITVQAGYSIICIVGESVINDKNTSKLFDILNHIPVRMISYGGSNNNISLLVETDKKIETLQFLNDKLFANTILPELVSN
ncbi:aspartate kinase [Aquimarina sp. W85]|uniref:aspartate kinase n=1 Tax=Aquimarina rhodophyticola TaxID=3342246 RepID=UPI0036727B7C